MDGYQAHRERSRPPYVRTASRSSTSTRMTSQSASSSTSHTSHISSSPQLHSAHLVHRYHQASHVKPPSSPRPACSGPTLHPQLSRDGSIESARRTPVSAFLQERLQKERQAGAASTPASTSDLAASLELGQSHKSPIKHAVTDANRPQSSSSDPAQRKGLALKEMEQVVSGLHKQNFDLKLELYHRRERQTMLEERMESIESEKTQLEEMNAKFLDEMEKRDKAIEEAVAMIVMLEAKVDELTKERNMVRQVEAQGFYGSPVYGTNIEGPPPPALTLDVTSPANEVRSLNRVPSFLSDNSERTENLRNVYLGSRGSVLSLPRVAESDVDNGHLHGLASPTLSVLSESSFVSVYGQKPQDTAPFTVDEPLSLDGNSGEAAGAPEVKPVHKPEATQPTPRSDSFSRVNAAGKFQPIASIMGGSPLQRIERLAPSCTPKRETSRPPSSGKGRSPSEPGKSPRSPGRKTTREEKREALRKVMTDSPGGVSLHEQVLPPTPDTVASSTLRRFKNSNDTLGRRHDSMEERSQDSLPHLSISHERLSGPEPFPTIPMERGARPVRDPKKSGGTKDPRWQRDQPPRPRSADESTVSHKRGHHWDLDSDSDDADSFESSLDIWLRAGSKAPRDGRTSPDLFGFPTNPSSGSWAMNAMFGPNNMASGGASITNPDTNQMHDLFSAQQALFGNGAPPLPNRRSSLNAQTGAKPSSPAEDESAPKPPTKVKPQKPRGRRARHFRRNSDDAQMRANMKTPAPGQFSQPPAPQQPNGDQKRNHYPPIAGYQGARNGLRGLFRRSLVGPPSTAGSESQQLPSNPEPAVAAEPSMDSQQQPAVASWVNRNTALDDDRSGATPPPILRNPRQGRGSVSEVDAYGRSTPEADGTPTTPVTAIAKGGHGHMLPTDQQPAEGSPAAGSATGSRRKWLPAFGRSSTLKNKTG